MVSQPTRGSLNTVAHCVPNTVNSRRTYVSCTSELFSRPEFVEYSATYEKFAGTCAASRIAPAQLPCHARTAAKNRGGSTRYSSG